MKKAKVLEKVLVYDKILRFTIDLLTGMREEIRADVEEAKIIGESLLTEEDLEVLTRFLHKVQTDFISKLDETLDTIYDEYETFNFDIALLSNIPDEIERDIDRLNLIENINANLKALKDLLLNACGPEANPRIGAVIAPFKVYCKLIDHAIEFNRKFEKI